MECCGEVRAMECCFSSARVVVVDWRSTIVCHDSLDLMKNQKNSMLRCIVVTSSERTSENIWHHWLTQMKIPSKNNSLNTSRKELHLIQLNKCTPTLMLLSERILLPKLPEKNSSRERGSFERRCLSHRRKTVPNKRKMLSARSWKRKTNDCFTCINLLEQWWLTIPKKK